MVFERSPYMALLCLLALSLVALPCQADTTPIPLVLEPAMDPIVPMNDGPSGPVAAGLPHGKPSEIAAAITVNDSPADMPLPAELPAPAGASNDSQAPQADDGAAPIPEAGPADTLNASSGEACAPLLYGPAEAVPAPEYMVTGTIYSVSSEGRRPWADGHLRVSVNGVRATMDGPTYSALLPGPCDPVEVVLEHDCGYPLGRSEGRVDPSGGTTTIDVAFPALEISGDVYDGDLPAAGASLFIYLNDRPFGPIEAASGRGPMFSVALPGGHPGDHVSITASRGDRSGIVSQDITGYNAFLTVNLKSTAMYMPYMDSVVPASPDGDTENSRISYTENSRISYTENNRMALRHWHSQLDD